VREDIIAEQLAHLVTMIVTTLFAPPMSDVVDDDPYIQDGGAMILVSTSCHAEPLRFLDFP
jgi:hypothetical protein